MTEVTDRSSWKRAREYRLPQDVKDRWIAALESGDYAQGSGMLADTRDNASGKYCCLGVLCEVLRAELGLSREILSDGMVAYDTTLDALPLAVSDRIMSMQDNPWVFIPDEDWTPVLWTVHDEVKRGNLNWARDNHAASEQPRGAVSLAKLNDCGVPFPVIAHVIRRYL